MTLSYLIPKNIPLSSHASTIISHNMKLSSALLPRHYRSQNSTLKLAPDSIVHGVESQAMNIS